MTIAVPTAFTSLLLLLLLLLLLFRGGESLSLSAVSANSGYHHLLGGGSAPPSFVNLPAFEKFCNGSVPLICIPNAIEENEEDDDDDRHHDGTKRRIEGWKQDAQALKSLSFGAVAGVAKSGATPADGRQNDIRSGVHQVWLESPDCPPQQHFVGNIDARKDLVRFVNAIRQCLDTSSNSNSNNGRHVRNLPPELVELSYLFYDSRCGASYAKHVDTFAEDDGATSGDRKRSVSFILYLGGGGDDNEDQDDLGAWDCARDGGALRIHEEIFAKATGQPVFYQNEEAKADCDSCCWSDITPQAGTIVLFDSATVPHEVVATRRSRMCVVGWLGTYRSSR